jgi:hypothetical protein
MLGRALAGLLVVASLALGPRPAAALSVITFESLPGDASAIPAGYGSAAAHGTGIPAGFGGFTWLPPQGRTGQTIAAVDWTDPRFEPLLNPPGNPTGFVTGATSGTTTAFNSVTVGAAAVAYITLIPLPGFETFDFVQAAWTGGFGPQTLTLEGRYQGATLYTTSFGVVREKSFVSQLNWTGLDQVVIFNSLSGSQWVLDNFAFRSGPPIPEPATVALLAAGLALLALRARLRRRPA